MQWQIQNKPDNEACRKFKYIYILPFNLADKTTEPVNYSPVISIYILN